MAVLTPTSSLTPQTRIGFVI